MAISSQIILDTLKSNKSEGIKLIFEHFYTRLIEISYRIVGNYEASEDIVQDFFVRIWEDDYLVRVNAHALPSYLFKSVRNKSISYLSVQGNRFTPLQEYDADTLIPFFTEIDESKCTIVWNQLQLLSPQSRKVIELIVISGLTYKETAKQLNISVNTVKTLLSRALRKLEKQCTIDLLHLLLYLFK